MKTCAFTYYIDYKDMTLEMVESWKHFHPDIPMLVFDRQCIERLWIEHPDMPKWSIGPMLSKLLSSRFDMIIHVDGDSLITAPLTELLEDDNWDVAGVRNNNDKGYMCHVSSPYVRTSLLTNKPIGIQKYLNLGFFAVKSKAFINEWYENTRKYGMSCQFWEQDTFNDLCDAGTYNVKILDPKESSV